MSKKWWMKKLTLILLGSLVGFLLSLFFLKTMAMNENFLVSNKTRFMIYACFMGLGSIVFIILFDMNAFYKSKQREVAIGIFTPFPAGQGQHGTAEWINNRDREKYFPYTEIDKKECQVFFNKGEEEMTDDVF